MKKQNSRKKLRVGFFSFTGCEGCWTVFVEVLNKNFFEWAPLLDIVEFKLLKPVRSLGEMDVAFIEGGITTNKELKKLKEIRQKAKYLVACGTSAVDHGYSAQRNFFNDEKKREIAPELKRLGQRKKYTSIPENVEVDDKIEGCPMDADKFVDVLKKYLKQFKVIE